MEKFIWDKNLKVRLVGEGLFNLLFWMYFPFITVYFGEILGFKIAGLLMSMPPILSIIGSLLGGNVADSLGRRPVMLFGTLIQMLMFVMFAFSTSPWIDYIAFIGIGIGFSLYRPASSAMVADLVPEKNLRQVFATFMTVNNIGAVLGPVIGAIFFFQYRQELLWTCAFVLFLYLMAIYYITYETLPKSKKELDLTSPLKHSFKQRWNGYTIIFRDKIFMVYVGAGIFSLFPIMQLDLYLPVYIINNVPAQPLFTWNGDSLILSSNEIFGWLVGFNGLLFVLFILPVTNWFKNWQERNIFILSSLLAGIGTFLVGMNNNIWYLLFVTVIFTFGEIVRTPVTQSFVSHYAPEHARGQYLAADSLQNTLGKAMAPLTVFLASFIPPVGIFSLIVAFSFIGVLLYIKLFRLYSPQLKMVDGD
ncbi:MFS transporter [Metabacillus sp. cB07]|uniref:MDR family MFS transporter n=1 Tax=Metabacillus sp. cB07 TaxID=2806989 RepID=UPI00193A3D83|nr:MFS transporter [Metabacillus sp. cB07]